MHYHTWKIMCSHIRGYQARNSSSYRSSAGKLHVKMKAVNFITVDRVGFHECVSEIQLSVSTPWRHTVEAAVHLLLLLLLLALQPFMSFGLPSSSLPCFSIHTHLTPILNFHFSQIRSDIIRPPSTSPSYCSWSTLLLFSPFFLYPLL